MQGNICASRKGTKGLCCIHNYAYSRQEIKLAAAVTKREQKASRYPFKNNYIPALDNGDFDSDWNYSILDGTLSWFNAILRFVA